MLYNELYTTNNTILITLNKNHHENHDTFMTFTVFAETKSEIKSAA